uniref:Ion transport domain-containing protein n=1 Tax=Rhizophagus irregularis (strain DAOM 181602 / DAOM 197198 / MUCL 43194) TaxID=747089 RepID=U9UU87_RHIID
MLSFKLINNQDLVLISRKGIFIFTINEDGIRLRYFWNNDEWNDIYKKFFVKFIEKHGEIHDNNFTNFTNKHYKPLIGRILKNEFDDSKHSIPLQKFIDEWDKKEIIEYVINDKFVSPKFGTEMLKIAIKKKCHDAVRQIIGSNQGYSENYMTIISLNLAELCDYYSDYIITYILRTSIMLSPYCNIIGNSKNTSLHSHVIYIKESNMDNIIFKFISELYNGLIRYLRIKEEIQTVSFIVPFPQICVYQDNSENNDHENHEIENNNHENHDTKNNDDENHDSQNNDHENENNDHKNHDFKNNDHENLLGYAQAFFIVLRSNSINDDNDPQNLATKYDFVNPDGIITNTTIIQDPDPNTNLFNWFPTSLLAVYNLLTGDSGSLSSFTYREHSIMTILLVTFTFFTVIYLMNLFIGLLNLAIDDFNKKEEFLLQKVQCSEQYESTRVNLTRLDF